MGKKSKRRAGAPSEAPSASDSAASSSSVTALALNLGQFMEQQQKQNEMMMRSMEMIMKIAVGKEGTAAGAAATSSAGGADQQQAAKDLGGGSTTASGAESSDEGVGRVPAALAEWACFAPARTPSADERSKISDFSRGQPTRHSDESVPEFLKRLKRWALRLNACGVGEDEIFDKILINGFSDRWMQTIAEGVKQKSLAKLAVELTNDACGSAGLQARDLLENLQTEKRQKGVKVSKWCKARLLEYQELLIMKESVSSVIVGEKMLVTVRLRNSTIEIVRSKIGLDTTVERVTDTLNTMVPNEINVWDEVENAKRGPQQPKPGGAFFTGGSSDAEPTCDDVSQGDWSADQWRDWFAAGMMTGQIMYNNGAGGPRGGPMNNKCQHGTSCWYYVKYGRCNKTHTAAELEVLKKKRAERMARAAADTPGGPPGGPAAAGNSSNTDPGTNSDKTEPSAMAHLHDVLHKNEIEKLDLTYLNSAADTASASKLICVDTGASSLVFPEGQAKKNNYQVLADGEHISFGTTMGTVVDVGVVRLAVRFRTADGGWSDWRPGQWRVLPGDFYALAGKDFQRANKFVCDMGGGRMSMGAFDLRVVPGSVLLGEAEFRPCDGAEIEFQIFLNSGMLAGAERPTSIEELGELFADLTAERKQFLVRLHHNGGHFADLAERVKNAREREFFNAIRENDLCAECAAFDKNKEAKYPVGFSQFSPIPNFIWAGDAVSTAMGVVYSITDLCSTKKGLALVDHYEAEHPQVPAALHKFKTKAGSWPTHFLFDPKSDGINNAVEDFLAEQEVNGVPVPYKTPWEIGKEERGHELLTRTVSKVLLQTGATKLQLVEEIVGIRGVSEEIANFVNTAYNSRKLDADEFLLKERILDYVEGLLNQQTTVRRTCYSPDNIHYGSIADTASGSQNLLDSFHKFYEKRYAMQVEVARKELVDKVNRFNSGYKLSRKITNIAELERGDMVRILRTHSKDSNAAQWFAGKPNWLQTGAVVGVDPVRDEALVRPAGTNKAQAYRAAQIKKFVFLADHIADGVPLESYMTAPIELRAAVRLLPGLQATHGKAKAPTAVGQTAPAAAGQQASSSSGKASDFLKKPPEIGGTIIKPPQSPSGKRAAVQEEAPRNNDVSSSSWQPPSVSRRLDPEAYRRKVMAFDAAEKAADAAQKAARTKRPGTEKSTGGLKAAVKIPVAAGELAEGGKTRSGGAADVAKKRVRSASSEEEEIFGPDPDHPRVASKSATSSIPKKIPKPKNNLSAGGGSDAAVAGGARSDEAAAPPPAKARKMQLHLLEELLAAKPPANSTRVDDRGGAYSTTAAEGSSFISIAGDGPKLSEEVLDFIASTNTKRAHVAECDGGLFLTESRDDDGETALRTSDDWKHYLSKCGTLTANTEYLQQLLSRRGRQTVFRSSFKDPIVTEATTLLNGRPVSASAAGFAGEIYVVEAKVVRPTCALRETEKYDVALGFGPESPLRVFQCGTDKRRSGELVLLLKTERPKNVQWSSITPAGCSLELSLAQVERLGLSHLVDPARDKEVEGIIGLDVFNLDEQCDTLPDSANAVSSRLVLTLKFNQGVFVKAKARWCARGFQDSRLGSGSLERRCHTLADSSLLVCMHWLAKMGHYEHIADISAAFLRGDPLIVLTDSNNVVASSNTLVRSPSEKNLRADYFYLAKLMEDGDLVLSHIRGIDNASDVLTKEFHKCSLDVCRAFFQQCRTNFDLPPQAKLLLEEDDKTGTGTG
eukprot:g20500.t1